MLKNCLVSITNGNLTPIIKAPAFSSVLVLDLQLIISLPSMPELPAYVDDPLITDEQRDALFWKHVAVSPNKKIATFWNQEKILDFSIFNRLPYYHEPLINRYTQRDSFAIEAGSSISLKLEATNSGLLGTGDYIKAWGVYDIVAA